jgi:hypothetical protein
MGLQEVMGAGSNNTPMGHVIAMLGCPLHSAERMDRFRLLLGEVAAPEAGAAALICRGSEE